MKTINPNFHKWIAVDDDSFVEKFGVDKYSIFFLLLILLFVCSFSFFTKVAFIY